MEPSIENLMAIPAATPAELKSMSEATPAQANLLVEESVELNQLHATSGLNLVKVEAKNEVQDEEVFSQRAALYRFAEGDWKERARGELKILKQEGTGKYRLVMHTDKVFKVRLNQFIGDISLEPNPGCESAWNWRNQDWANESGEAEVHSFAVRFRTKEIATEFNEKWEVGRAINKEYNLKKATEAGVEVQDGDDKPVEETAAEEVKVEEKPAEAVEEKKD